VITTSSGGRTDAFFHSSFAATFHMDGSWK